MKSEKAFTSSNIRNKIFSKEKRCRDIVISIQTLQCRGVRLRNCEYLKYYGKSCQRENMSLVQNAVLMNSVEYKKHKKSRCVSSKAALNIRLLLGQMYVVLACIIRL
jgi:hypothetical protein